MQTAYEEILDFVTSAPSLAQIAAFSHSEATQERIAYLFAAQEAETITPEERDELREFEKAAYFIAQLKVRARRRLDAGKQPPV